ncbi:TolC family protein [Paenibacillus sp. y28]|uniref:TolC family protein n=1 Tax=Paenibacillus sp. y28 TaxID=3129110 RepID=UPI00301654A8
MYWLRAATCGLLIGGLLSGAVTLPAYAEGKRITLEEAVQEAMKRSADLKDARMAVDKKQKELQQAQEAVNHQAAKDSSLFAKPHSLSKDLEIRLKVPEARNQYNGALMDEAAARRKVKAAAEKLYFNSLQAIEQEKLVRQRQEEAAREEKELRTKLRFGVVAQQEVDTAAESLAAVNSELKQARLSLKSASMQLAEAIGTNPEAELELELRPRYAILNQDRLWRSMSYAEKNDTALYKDTAARMLAEEKVNVTRRLYTNKFGPGTVQIIEAMYAAPGPEMDYELFNASYDRMLDNIKKQWEGFYLIPVPFLPILPIPKVILQGEYDGLRYFDDMKYSLPVSMLDQDKARLKEAETRKNLILQTKQSFYDTKASEEAFAQALIKADKARQALDNAGKKHQAGWMTEEEYKAVQEALAEAEKGAVTGLFSYLSALSAFNMATSGALDSAYVDGWLPYGDIDDGLSPLQQPQDQLSPGQLAGAWTLKDAVEGVTSTFRVSIPPAVGATHYTLLTDQGVTVGDPVKLTEPVIHVNAVFGEMSLLKVQLLQDGKPVAEALVEGSGSGGALQIQLADKGESG